MGSLRGRRREEAMTKKRDLKRRIRRRQDRTGESYMSARRRVLATQPAAKMVTVVDLLDLSSKAAGLGLRCGLAMFPALADKTEPVRVVTALRDVLLGLASKRPIAMLCKVAFSVGAPQPAV